MIRRMIAALLLAAAAVGVSATTADAKPADVQSNHWTWTG
jgi:Spy/CpxP family protein refolding chaperone